MLILVFLPWANMYILFLYGSFVAKAFYTYIGVFIGIILSSLLIVPYLIRSISVPLYFVPYLEPFLLVLSYLNYLIIGLFAASAFYMNKECEIV